MIKKLLLMGTVMGYIGGCGSDTVNNNYYGAGKGDSGGSYTCQDAFSNEVDCGIAIEEGFYADKRDAMIAQGVQKCLKLNLSSDCLGCIATAPCNVEQKRSPLYFCNEEGYCDFK